MATIMALVKIVNLSNQDNIYIITHYIKKYSDSLNIVFEYIEHKHIDNEYKILEDKFEIKKSYLF